MSMSAHTPPAIGQHWPEQCGTYIGIASDLPGGEPGYLVLLDAKPTKRMTWAQAKTWAKKIGGDARLPTRTEALLIYANARQKVEKSWHWTSDGYDASCAWNCYFSSGTQLTSRKDDELAAVSVRRLGIQSFNPLNGGAA